MQCYTRTEELVKGWLGMGWREWLEFTVTAYQFGFKWKDSKDLVRGVSRNRAKFLAGKISVSFLHLGHRSQAQSRPAWNIQ